MSFEFVVQNTSNIAGPEEDLLDLSGEDISLIDGDYSETANGDLATVVNLDCAKQSAIRETINNPGSFPRRPQWGAGIAALLFKGSTPNTRDRIVSRTRSRLIQNLRITKVHEVSASTDTFGTRVFMRCDAVGGRFEATALVKPPGV